jgi:ADP-dependent NAD(P)H-hydrate dehydratase / NAD(P)H-hydrate epimerase
MRPVLSPAESAALDRESQARGVSVDSLMENAGRAVARAALTLTGGAYGRRAAVICGKGNNGGDGLVAARHLARLGARSEVVLLADPDSLAGPTAANLGRASEAGVPISRLSKEALQRKVARADVVIDALFGTGFRGKPEGDHAMGIAALNSATAPVVAVDIPSGVNGETGDVEGEAVWADVTVTFGAAKPGLVLFPGAAHAGVIEVSDIGFPPELMHSDLQLVEERDVATQLPRRRPDDEKRATGVVLVIGGSRGMTGAVRLMAEAAYRAGAGLVSVATPASVVPIVQGGLVEATYTPLPETADGTVARGAVDALGDRLRSFDAVALGPGLTRHPETAEFVRLLVRSCPVPMVLDADGLNAFEGRASDLAEREGPLVLTPHAGEFGRLAGMAPSDVLRDRVGHARKLAAEVQGIVVLKGNPSLVAGAGGEVRINTTGGPSLATGGSGDVGTGTIAAMLARGLDPMDAAMAGAYVHGLAGTLAGMELGEGTTARDVLRYIAIAILTLKGEA